VLALDRFVAALPELKNNEPVQSIPDFDPKQFSDALHNFSTVLAAH
jgi:hypothetical protein